MNHICSLNHTTVQQKVPLINHYNRHDRYNLWVQLDKWLVAIFGPYFCLNTSAYIVLNSIAIYHGTSGKSYMYTVHVHVSANLKMLTIS